jgi:hypothetical protein
VAFEEPDWQNRGAGCYPIGSEHVVKEEKWWKKYTVQKI